MSIVPPKVILRIGSHAEKEYFEKLAKNLDAIMFGGNLLEITPAATCSLLFSLRAKRNDAAIPFYLDPMTYCFGPYVDINTKEKRGDLEALKSERLEHRGSKTKIKAVKDSYMSLADQLGPVFRSATNDGKSCRAVEASTLSSADRNSMCQDVIAYQLNRLNEILSGDDLMKEAFSGDAKPSAVFAPYFFIHQTWAMDGLNLSLDLAARSAALQPELPVHAVICASHDLLGSAPAVKFLQDELPKTKISGVWLWFDGFDEFAAPIEELRAFRALVCSLKGMMEVYNLHGGYFSLLLAHEGMTGISHGVGYGEQKTVQQIIGAAAPTVRYYLPPIARRVGIPDIQRAFPDLKIQGPADFFAKVCSCQICKGVIGADLSRFRAFGEMHRANGESRRDTQTPAAAKMCRYHFLLNRLKEPKVVAELNPADRAAHLVSRANPWRGCHTLMQYFCEASGEGYPERWAKTLA